MHAVHTMSTKPLQGLSGRWAPQVTPWPANLPCQSTMVTLNSWGNAGRGRLTPALAIKHNKKTIRLTRGSQLTPRGALLLARFNPVRCVGGWRTDPWGEQRGVGHEMKYVQAGCDCPTSVNLICTSSLLPGYATMKSISMIP